MIKNKIIVLIILSVLTMSACKRQAHKKKIEKETETAVAIVDTAMVEKPVVEIVKETPKPTEKLNIDPAEVDFKYLKLKTKITLDEQSFPASVNIRKDSLIWISISVGLEAARGIITRDSLIFLDRLHRNYYKFDFKSLSQQLNFDVNYDLIQALIIGNMPIKKRENDVITKEENTFKISQDLQLFQLENMIDGENRKLRQIKGKSANGTSNLKIDYDNFLVLNQFLMPQNISTQIDAKTSDKEIKTVVNLQHNKIEIVEQNPGFSFSIPKTYQPAVLKK
jgi:hypothetical protein